MTRAEAGSERRLGWALALTSTLTMAVSYFDRQTLAVLAPTVTKALDISNASYGWLASAFSIAYLAGAPVAGRLIDFVGARRGLLGAVLTWSVIAGLHALAPGFGVLFGLRIALGLAESPSFPGAAQTVHRALPPEKRAPGGGAAPVRPRGEWLQVVRHPAVIRGVIAVIATSPGLSFAFLWNAKFLDF